MLNEGTVCCPPVPSEQKGAATNAAQGVAVIHCREN
jgi:hypothetical protein